MENMGFNLINSMPKSVLDVLEVEAYDIIEAMLEQELLDKYLAMTREHKLEAEGVSMWQSTEDDSQYMIQVEFKNFDDSLYIPAKEHQLKEVPTTEEKEEVN